MWGVWIVAPGVVRIMFARYPENGIPLILQPISSLVQLESWYGALTGFKAENGLNGKVTEQGDSYDLQIRGLSIDQLVKITGYLKQL